MGLIFILALWAQIGHLCKMPKMITVDFYHVKVSGEDTFVQAMTTIRGLPTDETRNMHFLDMPVRMRHISQQNSTWRGDVMRIRLNESAIVANLDGSIRPVDVDENSGLGENTAFIYDQSLEVIAVQRNKTAVNASKLAHYFGTKGGLTNAVIFEPILRAGAMQKLQNMRHVKKFHLKIARPTNLNDIVGETPSVVAAAQIAQDFESPTVEVIVSMGHHKGDLRKPSIVESVRKLLRMHSANETTVQKIEVGGKNAEDDTVDSLDLIEECVRDSVPVEVSPLMDEFYRRRLAALETAFDHNRAEITRLVS